MIATRTLNQGLTHWLHGKLTSLYPNGDQLPPPIVTFQDVFRLGQEMVTHFGELPLVMIPLSIMRSLAHTS